MNDIFKLTDNSRKYNVSLETPKPNQATFRTRGLKSYGPKV